MQRDENWLHINNGQQIDAIQMSYGKTGVVYTDGPDGMAYSQIVGTPASVIFPMPHKIQNGD